MHLSFLFFIAQFHCGFGLFPLNVNDFLEVNWNISKIDFAFSITFTRAITQNMPDCRTPRLTNPLHRH